MKKSHYNHWFQSDLLSEPMSNASTDDVFHNKQHAEFLGVKNIQYIVFQLLRGRAPDMGTQVTLG